MVFHDLTKNRECPSGCKQLLGLGTKFVITPLLTTSPDDIQKSLFRFERDIALKAHFAGEDEEESGDGRLSKLYIPSKWIPPERFQPLGLKQRLNAFRAAITPLFTAAKAQPNLSPPQIKMLREFNNDDRIITVNTDKGLGIARIERDQYVKDAFKHHFNDRTTYQLITTAEANARAEMVRDAIASWLEKHGRAVGKDVCKYIRHHVAECTHPFPFFYQLYKIHKEPIKTRPVISGCGSLLHALGHWIDEQLQPIARTMPGYFKSSYELKEDLIPLKLPPNAVIFTADATSMYTNIDTDFALTIIEEFIEEHEAKFPDLQFRALIPALHLVMKNMVCVFGDLHFKQLKGTAMGTPPAPPWATIFFGIHELQLLKEFTVDRLPYYKRFIDDIVGIWLKHPDPVEDETLWTAFKDRVNDGGLEWILTERGKRIDFMDLTISIVDDHIETTLFEKAMALYQYIPPSSAHPPGLLNGLVVGQVLRFHQLCTSTSDVHNKMRLLFRRLIQRGYSREDLLPYFRSGLATAKTFLALPLAQRLEDKTLLRSDPNQVFFHLKFHPDDVHSSKIQALWRELLLEPAGSQPLPELTNLNFNAPIGINRMVVAYSRHGNIGSKLSVRRFDRLKGQPVSSYNLHDATVIPHTI